MVLIRQPLRFLIVMSKVVKRWCMWVQAVHSIGMIVVISMSTRYSLTPTELTIFLEPQTMISDFQGVHFVLMPVTIALCLVK